LEKEFSVFLIASVFFFKIGFAYTAKRAYPVCRQFIPRSSSGNAMFGIAFGFVVDISTDGTL